MIKNLKKKLKKFTLHKQEENLFGWLVERKHETFRMLVCSFVIVSLLFLPYVNLFVSEGVVFFLLIISALIIYNISTKKIILLSIFLIFLSLPLVLMGEHKSAELLGNIVYGVVFLGAIKNLYDSIS